MTMTDYSKYWAFIEAEKYRKDDFIKYILKNILANISPYGWYDILTMGIKGSYEELVNLTGYDILVDFCENYGEAV